MWIYLLAPFLSLFPRRWRKAVPFYDAVPWRFGAVVSGVVESLIALGALAYWYSYSVTTWVSNALDSALSKTAPTGLSVNDVGFAAIVVWFTHPLTWAIALVGVEGIARVCATLADSVLGLFPLYLTEKVYSKIFRRGQPDRPVIAKFSQSHVASYVGTVRDKVISARIAQVPDELCVSKNDLEEFLEIRASRQKPEWDAPRVVRYEDRYYRLEECSRGPAPRPFVYKLRRLAAGVPGRTVLTYSPDETPILATR
ncbi:MAG TPA: hypothetical protein VKH15_14605 [Candidatus Acidoferrum sp.]|nr:hypothetical protein [Candidatus Acidoferrum sp.]